LSRAVSSRALLARLRCCPRLCMELSQQLRSSRYTLSRSSRLSTVGSGGVSIVGGRYNHAANLSGTNPALP
jgi:hypothetical protein